MALKKGLPIVFASIVSVFSAAAESGLDFEGWLGVFSVSYGMDFTNRSEDDPVGLFGIGFSAPLLFNEKSLSEDEDEWFEDTVFFKIEPAVSAEYTFSLFDADLFRLRGGARIGRFYTCILVSSAYYAGLSGVFLNDLTKGGQTVGISPEIGAEFYLLFCGVRLQAHYDFYTAPEYNRFVLTISFCVQVPFGFL